jgi:adenosylhomocysteine nucleosidase
MDRTSQPLVLISANAEWRAVRELLPEMAVEHSPFGEAGQAVLGGQPVTLLQGGWGKISAAASAQFALDHFSPSLLVNLGTCGGFAGRIEVGTIILVERALVYDILEQMGDADQAVAHYVTDVDLSWLKGEAVAAAGASVQRGLMVSGDRDILPGDIAALISNFGAVAADWESGAIAWVAARNGARCLILRGVTDLVDPTGGEAYGNLALYHTRTPTVMGQLLEILPRYLAAARPVDR